MASNSANRRAPNGGRRPPETDDRPAGKRIWLGRWVVILAIIAFLGVYVTQLAAGSGLFFSVLISTAAMGVVGLAGLAVRQMILHSAAKERADDVLQQAGATRRNTIEEASEERENA